MHSPEGTLSSAVVVLFVARIFNLRSFHLEIYGGLAVFLLYIIYDTQVSQGSVCFEQFCILVLGVNDQAESLLESID